MNFPIIKKKINLQIFISYLGVLPFIMATLDCIFFKYFAKNFLIDFIIFYTLIIFSFIGAIRWSYNVLPNAIHVLYGFIPSLISTILIFLNLLDFNKNLIILLIFNLIFLQLIVDFLIYKYVKNEVFFLSLRLPVTIIILSNMAYFISV